MRVIINDEMTIATITTGTDVNQINYSAVGNATEMKMRYDVGVGMGYDTGMEVEIQKPSIFASTLFLVILTVVVLLAGVGAGLLIAKKKIKKGLDYDENY